MQQQGKWHNPKYSSSSSSFWVCSSGASVPEEINDKENPRWEIRAEQSLLKAENLQKHARWVLMLGKNTDLYVQAIFKGKQLEPVWQTLVGISVSITWPVYDILHLKLHKSFT